MLQNKKEKVQCEISKWRSADIIAIIIILFFSMCGVNYLYYQILILAAIMVLPAIIFMRSLYNKEIERSNKFKRTTALIRTFSYTVVIIAVILPFTMGNDWKWYYPIQKLIYGVDEEAQHFLPDKIPDNAEKYEVIFCRAAFPGATRIEISFFTDSQTLDIYRDKAIKSGAVSSSKNASKNRWYNEMSAKGVPYEQAEFYFYPGGSEHFPKVYILEETTGYVKIYY